MTLRATPLWLCAVAGLLAAACSGTGLAEIDGALLAQADAVLEPMDGETFVIKGEDHSAQEKAIDALPAGTVVRLAIDGEVPWKTVESLIDRVERQHKRLVLLVGKRHKVRALRLSDELEGPAVELIAMVDGKACVRPPGSVEAGCVQTVEEKHIDRAYVRELVREARKAYQLSDVVVQVDPALGWANVVRAIDGARTCCQDQPMRVALKNAQVDASL